MKKKKVLKIRSMISTETLRIQKTLQSPNISSVPLIPFEDDACWSLNITDFPLLWRRSSCFFFLFFLFRLPAHPPQHGGCRLWLPRERCQRLPVPAERSSWWTERELKVTELTKWEATWWWDETTFRSRESLTSSRCPRPLSPPGTCVSSRSERWTTRPGGSGRSRATRRSQRQQSPHLTHLHKTRHFHIC